jgi:hypothetical protein
MINFKLMPFFPDTPLASKNDALYRSGQNWLKNHHLAISIQIRKTHCKFVSESESASNIKNTVELGYNNE